MEQGNLRCDANVSVRPRGKKEFGVNTEVKNMNSFTGVEKALTYELERQIEILEKGGKIEHQTLLWDEKLQKVCFMRTKEESPDYRYFPEPDLVRLVVTSEWIAKIKKTLPELPEQKKQRFIKEYKIPPYDAEVLTASKDLAFWYEQGVKIYPHPKIFSNWVLGEILRELKEKKIEITDFKLTPQDLVNLLKLVDEGLISGKIAKNVFKEMAETGKKAKDIVEEKSLVQVTDRSQIETLVDAILYENKKEVQEYLAGKKKIFGFFVGEVMKKSKGKAHPQLVNEILKEKLKK
jgi:aspartyl-tRNA(Asn)/glutamyl-tRNA(Gln) amidotransferase subunit B